jgi:hypothetical protein
LCERDKQHTSAHTEAEWLHETEQFREVLQKKHGSIGDHLLPGVCGAGDGLVIQIIEPVTVDLDGKPSRNYMNRKGFFALLVQAFCGAYTTFWYFNVGWPGATNDITAYKQTDLYPAATKNTIPDWVSFLLDEAYSSCGGRHLTPFSQHQLRRAFGVGTNTLYYQMRTFNHVLSSGVWGILWCANSSRLRNVSVVVLVCAKLHNLCVDRWITLGKSANGLHITGQEHVPLHDGIDNSRPTDVEVQTRLRNRYDEISSRAVVWSEGPLDLDLTGKGKVVSEKQMCLIAYKGS